MKIKLASVCVDDVRHGPFRWLPVASAEEPTGAELQLALNDDPAVLHQTDDVQADCERLLARGARTTCRRPGSPARPSPCWTTPAATSSS